MVFVNQFGWDRERCGSRMPVELEFMDLLKGTDVEFGQSIYEPFGIAQVEPLAFGALCVVSSVCGCVGFVARAAETAGNLIVADYVTPAAPVGLDGLKRIGAVKRDRMEGERSREVAREILKRLPASDAERQEALQEGTVWQKPELEPGLCRSVPARIGEGRQEQRKRFGRSGVYLKRCETLNF